MLRQIESRAELQITLAHVHSHEMFCMRDGRRQPPRRGVAVVAATSVRSSATAAVLRMATEMSTRHAAAGGDALSTDGAKTRGGAADDRGRRVAGAAAPLRARATDDEKVGCRRRARGCGWSRRRCSRRRDSSPSRRRRGGGGCPTRQRSVRMRASMTWPKMTGEMSRVCRRATAAPPTTHRPSIGGCRYTCLPGPQLRLRRSGDPLGGRHYDNCMNDGLGGVVAPPYDGNGGVAAQLRRPAAAFVASRCRPSTCTAPPG